MPSQHALIIAMDGFLHESWGNVPYAEKSASKVATALTKAGVNKSNIIVIHGRYATLAGIDSSIRKLRNNLKRGDSALVYLIGRCASIAGKSQMFAWDTIPDDWQETSYPFASLFKELASSRAGFVSLFLDIGAGSIPFNEDTTPHWHKEELQALIQTSDKFVVLGSCATGEPSAWLANAEASAWTAVICEAFATPHTGHTLQARIDSMLLTLLRKHGEATTPHPWCLGDTETSILELPKRKAKSTEPGLQPGQLQRLVFRGETTARIRELQGFRKSFRIPDSAGPSTRAFIINCAAHEIREEIDLIAEQIRATFHYKRKDVHLNILKGKNPATIRTPDFEYALSIVPNADDPSQVIWRREIGQFSDRAVIESPEFQSAFGPMVSEIALEFEKFIDVEEFANAWESSGSLRWHGNTCELHVKGMSGSILVSKKELVVRGKLGNPSGLLQQFLHFMQKNDTLSSSIALTS